MGVYDIYENVQIKTGPCELKVYKIGDSVPIQDGIYIGHEGVIVIYKGKFIMEKGFIKTKWGEPISSEEILKPYDPFRQILEK